jgi:hypothetical protein
MSYTDHAGFGEQDAAAPHRAPPKHQLPTVAIMLMLGLAVALSAAALAVTLLHAGPRGAAGPAGANGQNAPQLNYTCQQLFPKNGPNGTETTMYWPCTDNPAG